MDNYLLFGTSGHARVVADCVEQGGGHVAGCLDSYKPAGAVVYGYSVLGREDDSGRLARKFDAGLVLAVGDNWGRARLAERFKKISPDLRFPALVHPSARIGRDVTIGDGTVILAGAVVNPGTTIGRFCLLNTHCSLDHDSVMGEFSSLAPGVTVGGGVTIGAFSAISLGASVIHRIQIGEHTVIGAGAVVVRNIPSQVIAYGNPARVQRQRQPGDPYL